MKPAIRITMFMALAAAAPLASAQNYGYDNRYGTPDNTVRCESRNGRTEFCQIDVRGGVQMVQQHSQTACVQGRTWGVDRGGVWVSNGCRATFAVNTVYYGNNAYGNNGYYGNNGGYYGNNTYGNNGYYGSNGYGAQTFRCESNGGQPRQCDIDTRGGVRLVRQISSSRCVQGQTWGIARYGIWVSNGCRAEFQVGYAGNNGYGYGQYGNNGYNNGYGNSGYYGDQGYGAQTVSCESRSGQTSMCAFNRPVSRVELRNQTSQSACIQGQTWGWDQRGIWVTQGCRAEFTVW